VSTRLKREKELPDDINLAIGRDVPGIEVRIARFQCNAFVQPRRVADVGGFDSVRFTIDLNRVSVASSFAILFQ
jgi:hypothetical protein